MAKSSLSACQLIFAFLFKATLNLEHRNLTQVKTLPCKPQSSRGKTFPSARYGTDLRITNKFYVILSKSQTPVSWDIWPKKGNSRFWQDCQKSFCLFCTMFKTNVPSYTKMKQWCLIQLLPISLQCCCSPVAENTFKVRCRRQMYLYISIILHGTSQGVKYSFPSLSPDVKGWKDC